MLALTTYRRNQFANLKAQLESDGYTYISALELDSTAKASRLCQGNQVALDVSSLLPLFDPNNNRTATAAIEESILYQLPKGILFIADEAAVTGQEYNLRTLFEPIEKSTVEGSPIAATAPANRVLKRLIDLTPEQTAEVLNDFDRQLIGQHKFKQALRRQVNIFRLFNSIGEQPILSMLLLGPSGVGKTETARILSKKLAPDEPLPKINFGNYSSKDSLNSLIGSPRGYMGSEKGELTLKIEGSESGVVLIDEFEKADPAVWNFFLDLLESGHFTDSQGEVHDLNGYIIVFTSNTPCDELRKKFPTELLSRFNLIAKFALLNVEEKEEFIRRYIEGIAEKCHQVKGGIPASPSVAKAALASLDIAQVDNIRILKNTARDWFADYIKENDIP